MRDSPEERLAALDLLHGKGKGLSEYIRGPFNWPGCKTQSLKYLEQLVPVSKMYVEAFGGSGIVLLNRPRAFKEVYNDKHSGLASFFIALRDHPQELAARLKVELYSREIFDHYKATWMHQEDQVERAARWFYTIVLSYNQLGRNFGRFTDVKETPLISRVDHLVDAAQILSIRLRRVLIENTTWEDILGKYDSPETTFYLDPPYIQTPNGTYAHNLKLDDHVNMLDWIFELQGTVCLSGYAHDMLLKRPWDEVHNWRVKDNMTDLQHNPTRSKARLEKRPEDIEYLYIKRSAIWQGNTKQIIQSSI